MGFSSFFLQSPVPWIVLAAFFFGAGIHRITKSVKKTNDPEKARNNKLVFACICFSFGIVAGLLSIIIPGPAKFLALDNLWIFLVCTIVVFFVFRFKKAVMIPVFLLFAGFVVSILLFIQSITAFTGETEIAKINVLSVKDSKMKLDLTQANNPVPVLLEMEGAYFAPVVRIVVFDDLLVFFGAKTWYRFVGMSSYAQSVENTIAVQKDIVAFPHPNGISEALFAFYENNETIIPGIKTVQTDVIQKRVKEFASYSIRVQNDGGVEVIELR
jgi:hypothetical protein